MADTGNEKIGYVLLFLTIFLSGFAALVMFMPPELVNQQPGNSYFGEYPSSFDPSDVLHYQFYYPINGYYLYGNASGGTYSDWLLGGWHVSDPVPFTFAKNEGDLSNEDSQIRIYYLDSPFTAPTDGRPERDFNSGLFIEEDRGWWYGRKVSVITFDEIKAQYSANTGFATLTVQGVRNHPNFVVFIQPEPGYTINDVESGHAYIFVGESTELESVGATDVWSLVSRFFTFSMPYTGEATVDVILNLVISGPIVVLIVYIAVRLIALFIPFT